MTPARRRPWPLGMTEVNVLGGRIGGMMTLIDFVGCERSRRFYSGNAGRKIGMSARWGVHEIADGGP